MKEDKKDKKNKKESMTAIFKRKIRCNMCYQIPIIKELLLNQGINCFITSECLNRHGVFLCPIQDFATDKYQLDNIKCYNCNQVQNFVDSHSKLFHSCKECNKFMCHKCYNSHFQKFQKTHHVLRIDELDNKCYKHYGPFTHFCVQCNMNLCPLCTQREHYNHENVLDLKNMQQINDKEYNDITIKVEVQKAQIGIISLNLDKFTKLVNDKIGEYKNNLEMAIEFNSRLLNGYIPNKLNYQSIINIKKVIDIDITDIDFIKEIQEELYRIAELIKSKSSYKILSSTKNQKTNLDKELVKTVKDTLINKSETSSIDDFEDKFKEKDEFVDNELLEKIAKRNKKILSKDDIIGIIKNIYVINELDVYLLIIDNGIFFYDLESNELINYIDINEGFEYNEINSSAYYYNKNNNLIYLFIGTTSNKIKIFTIDENEDFKYKLIQELVLHKINGIFTNQNGKLLMLENQHILVYNINKDNEYEKESELEKEENNNIKKIYDTQNYFILTKKEENEIVFYDKMNLEKIFSIKDINNDDNTKMFELSKELICVSFKNVINVIDIKAKKVCYCYENKNEKINYIQCFEVINKGKIFVSYTLSGEDDKSILYTLEWNNTNLKEKEALKDLHCKIISKANNNKVIMYSKYGINALELKN